MHSRAPRTVCTPARWPDKKAGVLSHAREAAFFCLGFFGTFCAKTKSTKNKKGSFSKYLLKERTSRLTTFKNQ